MLAAVDSPFANRMLAAPTCARVACVVALLAAARIIACPSALLVVARVVLFIAYLPYMLGC